MGRALEMISGRVTAVGATITALTMSTGDSATVRSAPLDADTRLIQQWARNQAAGILRIRSPRLHDNVQGIRYRVTAANAMPLGVPGTWQKLVPQDALILELSGSAVAGQIEHGVFLNYYSNLPGIDARLAAPMDVMKRAVNLVTVETSLAPGVTGDYSGQVALNANFDLLKANTDYALIGYVVDAQCSAVALRGADSGNLRVGGPGNQTQRELTAKWFWWLSDQLNIPLIPIFNSANKAGILADALQDQAGGAVNVNWIFYELSVKTA